MHIPENYLSPASCAVMTAAMLPVWRNAVKNVDIKLAKEKIPLLGVGASFSFLAMMFNLPLPGGTTGHAVGGTLIAILLGPDAACIALSVALLLQAVIFGDGGILSFGANAFNMAFVLPYLGYYIYSIIKKIFRNNKNAAFTEKLATAIGSYIGINAAAFCAAVEFGLQPMLFKDKMGNALYCPYDLSISIPAMMIAHLTVAGIVEAIFSVAVSSFVRKSSESYIYTENSTYEKKNSYRGVFLLIAALIAATPLGLLADGSAWGEWGAEELADIVTGGKTLRVIPKAIAEGWSLNSLLPDYSVSGMNEITGYILSAIIGVALLIIIFKLIAIVFRRPKYAS